MDSKKEAAALAGACRDEVMGVGVRDYCPLPRKIRQRDRLLAYLHENRSISTLEARELLGIMSPASRVMELRRLGWCIVERFDKTQGCGRYYLLQAGDGDQQGVETG